MGLNMVDIIIVLVFAALGVFGWKKGFLRMGFGVISFVVAILLAGWLYPYIAQWLSQTAFYEWLVSVMTENLQSAEATGDSSLLSMLLQGGEELLIGSLVPKVVGILIDIAAFLLVIVAVKLILWLVQRILHLFSNLPVIGPLNRLAGVAMGLMEAYVVVTLLFAAIVVFLPARQDNGMIEAMAQSRMVETITTNNPILSWIDVEAL